MAVLEVQNVFKGINNNVPSLQLEKPNTDRYEYLNVINHGSYGVVYRAMDKEDGEIVAIKMEFNGWSKSTKREVALLMYHLPPHPSIVAFKQVFLDRSNRVFVVMEYLELDLKRFMDRWAKPLIVGEVKFLVKQILEGVAFLHENGVMHRDLKPSNILMNHKCQLKICDFGLSRLESGGAYTPGMVTLWYRAPELLLFGANMYTSAIDMWSVGCIMAELVLRDVLFKGNSEIEQLGLIMRGQVRGFFDLRSRLYSAVVFSGAPLLTRSGFDLLERLLAVDPNQRISARDALNHPWFNEYYGLSSS